MIIRVFGPSIMVIWVPDHCVHCLPSYSHWKWVSNKYSYIAINFSTYKLYTCTQSCIFLKVNKSVSLNFTEGDIIDFDIHIIHSDGKLAVSQKTSYESQEPIEVVSSVLGVWLDCLKSWPTDRVCHILSNQGV